MKYILLVCLIFVQGTHLANAQTATPSPAETKAEEANTNEKTDAKPTPTPVEIAKNAAPERSSIPMPAAGAYVKRDAAAQIPRFDTVPVIDGNLNEPMWQTAAVFGDFYQTQPGDNVKPTFPTEVLMGYDSKNLYVAYRIIQDKSSIRATVARRDNIFDDDYVGMYIDTFNDRRQAYTIFFNALGIQADGVFTEGRGEDYSVDIVMESKGVLTENGFIIEIAIPFKSLRYEAGKDKQWGLHLYRRVKYVNNELNSWMPNNRSVLGSLNKAGKITGLEGIETTRQLEISPSITLSQGGRRSKFSFTNDPSGRFINDGLKGEFGMTAKFSLTPTTTLDFAYNPDFAQVEADATVTSANQRFPIFFSEKRPFFLERIDIFQSPLNVVNTRAIVDPDIAAKLTGRRGKNTFGIMYASDKAPGNYSKDDREDLLLCKRRQLADPTVVCGIERMMDRNSEVGIVRLKRDIGPDNSLGMFGTAYSFVDRKNYTGGFDGRYRLNPKTVATFQVNGSHSRRHFYDYDTDKTTYHSRNGLGYNVYLERAGKNLYMNYLAEGKSQDYRSDVGFNSRTDTNYIGSFIRYETDKNPKKSIIYRRNFNATHIRYDWSGRTQVINSETDFMLALQRQTYIGTRFVLGYERVFEHEFGRKRKPATAQEPNGRTGAFFGPDSERSAMNKAFQGFIESSPIKKLFFLIFTEYTVGQMDYDLGGGKDFPRVSPAALALGQSAPYDPGPGDQLYLETVVRYQPTSALQTQLVYNKIRLVRHDTGLTAFDDNIFSSRSTYQFNRDIFARLRLDYSTMGNRLSPQLVFGWTPSPGKALYVGYSDAFNANGHNPYTGLREQGIHSNGRTFFIKMSYLFKKSF